MRASPFVIVGLLAAVTGGCGPRDADVRLARLAAERRNLEATFDALEERLLADQARVRFWREMRDRHESVTAIACASQEQHASEMALHLAPASRASLHRTRVATATGDPAPARVPGRR